MDNFEFNEDENDDFDILGLVEKYEDAIKNAHATFFDLDDVENIIDYYFQMGRRDDALAVIDKYINQYPFSVELLTKKALFLYGQKRIDEALQNLEIAEIYEPSHTYIYFLRAEIYAYLSRYDEAIEILHYLLTIVQKIEIVDVYMQLCDIYEDIGNLDKVYECIVESLKIDPLDEEALNRLNYYIESTGNFEDNISLHKQMIDEHPFNYLAWYNLACTYRGIDDYENAAEAYEFAIAINDNEDYFFQELAELHYKNNAPQKALDVLKDMCELFEADDEVYFLQGKCNEALGKIKMARYCYRKAVHENPAMSEAYFRIGETYKNEGLWEQAYKAFQKASELEKEQYEFCLAMAEAALEIGEHEVAVDVCESAIDIFTNRFEAYFILGKIMSTYNDNTNARLVLESGIETCKSTIELKYALCAISFIENKLIEGETKLRCLLDEDYNKHDCLFDFCSDLESNIQIIKIISDFQFSK
ncbi:MAG: tetratricopeptide repeat protein [Chitinophagales bacterium]